MADAVTAVENFPHHGGAVNGIVKGFLCLSGAILVQVQHTLHIHPGSFILMLTILPTAIALLLMYFVDVHNPHRRYNKKFLDAFSLMAVTVAGYMMVVIICDQVFVIGSAGQSVCFAILLLLIMSPAAIVVVVTLKGSEDGVKTARRASSSTAFMGSGQDVLSHKENLNVMQAIWLLFLAMACGMGSGLAKVNKLSQIRGSLWLHD
ncbi:hypothetical protein VPH35_132589 [Triticum aestivum]